MPATSRAVKITPEVPKITITGKVASSNAARPRDLADNCAYWADSDKAKGRRLLAKEGTTIECQDATAWAALTALKLEMLYNGRDVKAALVKAWEN